MSITDIPGSYEAFESWFDAHDTAHLQPNDDAAAIERATRMLMLTRIPRTLAPLGNALVSAMYDAPLRRAMQVDARLGGPGRSGLGVEDALTAATVVRSATNHGIVRRRDQDQELPQRVRDQPARSGLSGSIQHLSSRRRCYRSYSPSGLLRRRK